MVLCCSDSAWRCLKRDLIRQSQRAAADQTCPYLVHAVKSCSDDDFSDTCGLCSHAHGLLDRESLEKCLGDSAAASRSSGHHFSQPEIKQQDAITTFQSVDEVLIAACICGSLAVVRELLALRGDRAVDVHRGCEHAFERACFHGHTPIVCELLALRGGRGVDVHSQAAAAFRSACSQGNIGVVRELLRLTGKREIDVHARSDDGFWIAVRFGHVDVVRELLALEGERAMSLQLNASRKYMLAAAPCRTLRELLLLQDQRAFDLTWGSADGRCICLANRFNDCEYELCRELLQLAPCALPVDAPLSKAIGLSHMISYELALDGFWFSLSPHLEKACGAACHPALARQVTQQVLLHALQEAAAAAARGDSSTDDTMLCLLWEYCTLHAALPAVASSKLCWYVHFCARMAGQPGRNTKLPWLDTGAVKLDARVRDAVWCGLAVPYVPVRRQVDQPGLRGALVRVGRGRMVLHRAAARSRTQC